MAGFIWVGKISLRAGYFGDQRCSFVGAMSAVERYRSPMMRRDWLGNLQHHRL